jgi:3-oxoacyl-[acyl-carrier-protein] synthase II
LLASRYGFRGPCVAPIAACATGLVAALQGAALIRRGACDVAVVGGADASLEPLLLAAFRRMKALARVDDDPKLALRPWDRDRSGFLVGEGAAVLVLERLDHAKGRGATVYAELAGGALGADAYHETGLDPDPSGLARVIGRALLDAGLEPSEIDAVNVHGTATLANDPLESRAIRRAFGDDADRLVCSSNKAQIGHLLGAAGSAELAIAGLSVFQGFMPPTLNLDHPDVACDLDGTPKVGRSLVIRGLLKLSLGFGGHFAAAVLKSVD